MSVLTITDSNFDKEVMGSEKPVIIDFYAEWCGPCKMMSPVIDKIAEELGDTVKVGKVNSDENPQLVEQFEIMSIPTIFIFKNGEISKKFIGFTDKQEIIDAVK